MEQGQCDAKAVAIDPRIRINLAAIAGSYEARDTDPGSTPQDPLGAAPVSNPWIAILRGANIGFVPAVFGPFPSIASGVMQAEIICLETSHGRGFLVAVIALVGGHGGKGVGSSAREIENIGKTASIFWIVPP